VHKRVSEAGRAAVYQRWGHERVSDFWRDVFRHELHPLNLQPTYRDPTADGPHVPLPVPQYDVPELAQFARIVWGRIDDEDQPGYETAFLLERYDGEAAHYALVAGQTGSLSPLAQSTYLM